MKVSFDFDGTLSRSDVQNLAKFLISNNIEVWIVTSRTDTDTALERGWHWTKSQNETLYKVATECGILHSNIIFTNGVDKIEFLEGMGFIFHLDDDSDELWEIVKSGDRCKPINVNHIDWEKDCKECVGL